MKHLKVFENFNEQSAERNMSMVFSRNGGSSIYSVDLTNFPTQIKKDVTGVSREESDELSSLGIEDFIEVEDHYLTEVHLEYQMTPVKDSAGISDINFQLKRVKIVGEYEVWNEETDETDSVDFQIIDDGPFDERVTFTTTGLPIYPENVEIDMNGSMDHTNFKYWIEA